MLECQRHGPGLAQLQARPARHTAVPPLVRCVLSATFVSQVCRRTAAASGSSASGDGLGLPGRSADIAVAMINDNHALIVSIAGRYGKTPAQVLLAWGIQRGTADLTGSVTPSRIRENFDVTALPESAIQEISERLETRVRFNTVVEGGVPGFAEVPSDS